MNKFVLLWIVKVIQFEKNLYVTTYLKVLAVSNCKLLICNVLTLQDKNIEPFLFIKLRVNRISLKKLATQRIRSLDLCIQNSNFEIYNDPDHH